ncbi:hypothetical protein [Cupriavidus pinatubonensis]|uniref:Uncharacterized protein n=1 Tax=Cupriavidus pinatubonensis TaxID=248026 RepID=A0ABN7Y1A2_9BURK|nr:hypothetical protein [Cupriavidus pinatubonensis]CAG9165672.1 hypothetical protein LMG23994_00777 [Cupriavidus pinatubonensis]
MKDIKQHEDRVYGTDEVCGILARGISPDELESWPLVSLPEYVIAVARASAADPGQAELGELEEAQRARRGLRTEWGILVVDLRRMETDGHVLSVEAFLSADPYLEIPDLRRKGGEAAGDYLSDLMNCAIQLGPGGELVEELSGMGLEWEDNCQTGQVFFFIGFSEPGQELDFAELGVSLASWLGESDFDQIVNDVGTPAALRTETERSLLATTRDRLH